jgi:kynurenine formamidase
MPRENERVPTYADLKGRDDAPPGSAWNVFGPDDELGTLNHLTPGRVREAVAAVRTGEVINLDLPLNAIDPPMSPTRNSLRHTIFANNPSHRDDYLDGFYLQASSHLDGLRHIGHPEFGFYNEPDPAEFEAGNPLLGINRFTEHGIVGRGVLVDVDRFRRAQDRPIDHWGAERIPIVDVIDAAESQGVSFRPGDILLLRTGWAHHHFHELTAEERHEMKKPLRASGLLASEDTVAWLWDNQFALIATDNFGVEAIPAPDDSPWLMDAERRGDVPRTVYSGVMHNALIALLGFVLGELWALDELATRCAADGRWESLVVSSPLNLTGGVGSPANAVAIR